MVKVVITWESGEVETRELNNEDASKVAEVAKELEKIEQIAQRVSK